MDVHKGNWIGFTYDFPENKREIKSGDAITLQLRGTEMVLYDYLWTDEDYKQILDRLGLRIVEHHKPLGYDTDPVEWLDEKEVSPVSIYIIKKAQEKGTARKRDALEVQQLKALQQRAKTIRLKGNVTIFHYLRAVFVEGQRSVFTFFDIVGVVLFFFPALAQWLVADSAFARVIGGCIFLISFLWANYSLYRNLH